MAGPSTPDEIIAALKSGGFGGAAPTSTAPVARVYLGSNDDEFSSPFANKQVGDQGDLTDRLPPNHKATDNAPDVDTAANTIFGWSEKRLEAWEQTLLGSGLIEPGQYNYEDLVQKWQGAVEGASKLYAAGKKVTPQKYIEMYVGSRGIGGTGGGAGGEAAGGPSTTTNITPVQHVDDLDARAAANEAYSALLGREARGKEAGAIQAALNAYGKAHPSINTRVDDGKGNGTTTTTGGMSSAAAGQIVEDQAKAAPGYAEYQSASTYFNALQQALGATAQV